MSSSNNSSPSLTPTNTNSTSNGTPMSTNMQILSPASSISLAYNPNFKDTRWLTLEVCREYQRQKCNRSDTDCKFAHPAAHVEIINGKVIACYDSLKGKCTRKEPPCKYLHPPQHLKDQLLQNGKANLLIKQATLLAMQQQHQVVAAAAAAQQHQHQYLTNHGLLTQATTASLNSHHAYLHQPQPQQHHQIISYQQIIGPNGQTSLVPIIAATAATSAQQFQHAIYDPNTQQFIHAHPHYQQQQQQQQQQQMHHHLQQQQQQHLIASTHHNALLPHQRTDRLAQYAPTMLINICVDYQNGKCTKQANECALSHPPSHCPLDADSTLVIVCVDYVKGKCTRDTCKYFHPPDHLVSQLKKQKMTNNALVNAFNAQQQLQQQQQQMLATMNHSTYTHQPQFRAQLRPILIASSGPHTTNGYHNLQNGHHTLEELYAAASANAHIEHTPHLQLIPQTTHLYAQPNARHFIQHQQPQQQHQHTHHQSTSASSSANTSASSSTSSSVNSSQSSSNLNNAQTVDDQSSSLNNSNNSNNQSTDINNNTIKAAANNNNNNLTTISNSVTNTISTTAIANAATATIANAAAAIVSSTNNNNNNYNLNQNSKLSSISSTIAALNNVVKCENSLKRKHDSSNILNSLYVPDLANSCAIASPINSTTCATTLNSTLFTGIKRAAIADTKTGLPVYHQAANPYHTATVATQLPTQLIYQHPQFTTQTLLNQSTQPTAGIIPQSAATTTATYPLIHYYALNGALVSVGSSLVEYLDSNGKIMDMLQVCRDFKIGKCKRPQCKYVHLLNDHNTQISNGYVKVCMSHLNGTCSSDDLNCKYYHLNKQLLNIQMKKYKLKKEYFLSQSTSFINNNSIY